MFFYTKMPAEVKSIGDGYTKNNRCAWLYGRPVKRSFFSCADPSTFEVLDYDFSKDKHAVYRFGKRVKGVLDPRSFQIFNYVYRGDQYALYDFAIIKNFDGEFIDDFKLIANDLIDRKTFALLSYPYAKDKEHVYYIGKRIEDADTESFSVLLDAGKILRNRYAKDKEHAYYIGKKIEDADAESFSVIQNLSDLLAYDYAKDKEHAYYIGKRIEDADAESFEMIDKQCSRDKNHVYFYAQMDRDGRCKSETDL